MYRLAYASAATMEITRPAIQDLLDVARRNNARDGITGMLLLVDRSFFQVLEGPADRVAACFRRIRRDPRHSGVQVLIDEAAREPLFGDWSMGFREFDLDRPEAEAVSLDSFDLSPEALRQRAAGLGEQGWNVVHFMRTFYKINSQEDFLEPSETSWSRHTRSDTAG